MTDPVNHIKNQELSDPSLNGTTAHKDSVNGVALTKNVDGISRKDRRKDWWEKKNKKVDEKPADAVAATTEDGPEQTRPKLRNRDTIAKPDSLKYEPDYRGFHSKIMQNLYTNTSTKKKRKQTEASKRKANAGAEQDIKKQKTDEGNEALDLYKFSLNLINGDVDTSKSAASKDSKDKYVLFIGNLPYDVTREQLEEHFRKTGGIKSIRIPRDKATDKGRGFAYMEFDGRISHGIALRLHQTTLGGRKINVEFTSIGGGKSEARKEKLRQKNHKRRNMKMR
ncbi:uncharacterized protein LOC131936826 [Physella acuta]|uniref:uncharacterized protein LOC131936826 n=1 Tax=Physella acuta TaxID=109671 RepID=UPI0027DD0743|nr:uncharacterized protein LOC131936826 [Physella acuta]